MRASFMAICLAALGISVLGVAAWSDAQDRCLSRTKKKLIEWGWDQPTTAFLRKHIREMEKQPFDGVILDMQYTMEGETRNFAWTCFGTERIAPALLESAVADLKATTFDRFTDNFLRFNVCPGDVDWFDDWSSIVANARLAAAVARETGLKGWMLDVEQYQHALFDYASAKHTDRASFDEYVRQATRQGEAFMRAINREYPDITLLLTFGHSMVREHMRRGTRMDQDAYGLLPAFLDGMLSAATSMTRIIDAYEMAYAFKTGEEFLEAYHQIKSRGLEISMEPDRYRCLMQAGFGLWIDHASGSRGWHTEPGTFSQNLRTPEEMRDALRAALEVSDEYVWLYSQQLNWWTGKNVPGEYAEAVAAARQAVQDRSSQKVLGRTMPPLDQSAKTHKGWDDAATFGDLWEAYDGVVDLPKTWLFRLDPLDIGQEQAWFAPDLDESDWRPIQIGEWWEPQGYQYDGIGWYRVWFSIPASVADRELALSFGAVDESAWIYLDGQKIGEFDMGERGWDERFEITLPVGLPSDQLHLLAVRVWDRAVYGGIWKSVKLVAARSDRPDSATW